MRNLKKQIQKEAEEVSEALFNLLSKVQFPKFKKSIVMKIVFVIVFTFTSLSGTTSKVDLGDANAIISQRMSPQEEYVNTVKDNFQEKLVTEVNNYIIQIAPESKLSPEFLVKKCLEYDTDIIFVLAQAILESHFGTKGKAAETNSVWNVGTFDDGQILYRYLLLQALDLYFLLLKWLSVVNSEPA